MPECNATGVIAHEHRIGGDLTVFWWSVRTIHEIGRGGVWYLVLGHWERGYSRVFT